MEGTAFGRYRLVKMLGRGGMGEVWRADDTATERVVALKLLQTHLVNDPSFEQRFRREARAAAGLKNPHIVPIYDFGEINGRFYVSMQLVDGSDLHSLLERGPLDPDRGVRVIEEIASALHAAHRIGLVHRDVKPSNILVDDDGFAYLIDFGIARTAGESTLTPTGSALGTWAYMSPERLNTGSADARADIYALTCVLHEALTGQRPFSGDSLEQQIVGHLTKPPPRPSQVRPGIPESLDAVIARGMAKEPADRFATTNDLAVAARVALGATKPTASASDSADMQGATAQGRTHKTPGNASTKPKSTSRFSQRWPNPEGTDFTPYRDHVVGPENTRPRTRFGKGQMTLAAGAAAALTAALAGVLWLVAKASPTRDAASTSASQVPLTQPASTAAASSTQTIPSTSLTAGNNLPGADTLGWMNFPSARCDPGNQPAVIARTTLSVLVVCQISPGSYYYRAVRISDNASIELSNAVRSSIGFDVTNPADGSLRQIRSTYVRIEFPDGPVQMEPIIGQVTR